MPCIIAANLAKIMYTVIIAKRELHTNPIL